MMNEVMSLKPYILYAIVQAENIEHAEWKNEQTCPTLNLMSLEDFLCREAGKELPWEKKGRRKKK